MQKELTITGGRPLQGTLAVNGAKNSALPLLAATLLTDRPITLHNVPDLEDVSTMLEMISQLGKSVKAREQGTYTIEGAPDEHRAPPELVKKMRASFLVLAPLVGRLGQAEVALPGGCTIGSRPINLHLHGLSKLGTEVNQRDGKIRTSADRLRGSQIYLDYPSVGSTEQLLMGAVMAKGVTEIYNPAREPEIDDLIAFLRKLGADIEKTATEITVRGGQKLGGTDHDVIPDRIETGTYMIAAAVTGGSVTLQETNPGHLKAVSLKLRDAGVEVKESENSITVNGQRSLRGVTIKTLPYPGFPTDLQAPATAMLALALGKSVVEETVFDGRVDHVPELNKLGADITVSGSDTIFINGTDQLQGTSVTAPDIRAGASLVIGGLAAEGTTTVSGLEHIDRGYSDIGDKLSRLGAKVRRSA